MTTSPICHPTAPGHSAPPAQLLWLIGFLCGWSVSLELPLRNPIIGGKQFQTISEDVSVRNVLMHSVH